MSQKYRALYFPFRLIVFYIIGLNLWRLLFIFQNGVPDLFRPSLHGLRLDFSMACAAVLLSYLPWILFLIFGKNWLRSLNKWLTPMVWAFVCLIEFGSLLIYPEWGTTLDARAIGYLSNFNEAWSSSRDFISWKVSFFSLLILIVGLKRLEYLFEDWHPVRSYYFQSIIFLTLIGPLLFLGVRGGWQKLPIKPSDAFYGKDMKNNFAAVNKVWYMLYSLNKQTELKPIHSIEEIRDFQYIYSSEPCKSDTSLTSLKNKNIVILIAEGWSADMVKYLGGKENITPYFDSIASLSFRFTNAFSTGFRTDQGLMSILSGIPSVASLNMPNQLDKVLMYPSIVREFIGAGYKTSFVYGGDLNFSNLYNYLALSGFDTIISDRSFAYSDDITEWGVPDHIMVQKAVALANIETQPFFSAILLMSSHSPFDIPIQNNFSAGSDIPSKYKASVKYSDHALQLFFESARDKDWFTNTIFIITSDHGSTHSGYASMDDHKRFRIPLIIYTPGMKISPENEINETPCNHFDLPFTLAEMGGLNTKRFIFGRNIFCDDSKRMGYWNTDNTAASFKTDNNEIVRATEKNTQATLFTDMVKKWFNELAK